MNDQQRCVHHFHRKFHQEIGTGDPRTSSAELLHLRADLIEEEARETVEALRALAALKQVPGTPTPASDYQERQLVLDAVDGLADVLYVTLGTAVAFGIDLDEHFHEVHRANMRKQVVPRAPGEKYGKGGGKGPGWQPPNHAKLLGYPES
jgi:predicted HAD superfamily Cof-like phosphohydrolase